MDVLVAYDIETTTLAGQRRLARVAKICEGYGIRVQYSLFECRLTEADLARLQIELEDVLDTHADHIRFYRFPGDVADSRQTLGRSRGPELNDLWVW
jgi:CRISPR-associated protein Cas2